MWYSWRYPWEAISDAKSQGIELKQDYPSKSHAVGVLSLVCKWPTYEMTTLDNYRYCRIMNAGVASATSSLSPNERVFIIPTDDDYLSVFLIPTTLLEAAKAPNTDLIR